MQKYVKWNLERYDEIRALVLQSYPHFPEVQDFGGIGVYAEEDGKIVGFVWCMINDTGKLGYVDFFVADNAFRHKNEVGPLLMLNLFKYLVPAGVKKIYGTLVSGTGYDLSLARVYSDVGMDFIPASYHLQGDTLTILQGIIGRYNYGRIENNTDHKATSSD